MKKQSSLLMPSCIQKNYDPEDFGNFLSIAKLWLVLLFFVILGCSRDEMNINPGKAGLAVEKSQPSGAILAGTPLPGGRSYYTVAVMGGSYPNVWCRIAEYTFTAGSGSSGTVSEQFKYWNQNFSGGVSTWKVNSGYTTSGYYTTL